MEEIDEKTVNHVFDTDVISFDIAQKDKYELDLQGKFEVVLREGKYYVERIKPQYPKDYVECCKVLGLRIMENYGSGYKRELIIPLQELLICLDAYWKIAGEEMGLDKPWEPDWKNNSQQKYTIFYYQDEITLSKGPNVNRLLSFPTPEMRNAFFENFKNLINECKKLL